MIDHCTDPDHTTVTVTEGDYERCGECGRRLREGDPRTEPTPAGRRICCATSWGKPHTPGCPMEPTPDNPVDYHGPAEIAQPDVFDATSPPGVTQLPAVTTSMTPAQFKEWLAADGTLFMVILPANRTFVIKVPAPQHEFFVAMMQQVRFALGPEVQAVRMNVVTGDPAAADGTATEAPDWAKPADNIARPSGEQDQPPTRHEYRDDIRHTVQHDIAGYAHVDIDGPQLHSVTCTCGHTATGDTKHDAYRSHNTHALHPEA